MKMEKVKNKIKNKIKEILKGFSSEVAMKASLVMSSLSMVASLILIVHGFWLRKNYTPKWIFKDLEKRVDSTILFAEGIRLNTFVSRLISDKITSQLGVGLQNRGRYYSLDDGREVYENQALGYAVIKPSSLFLNTINGDYHISSEKFSGIFISASNNPYFALDYFIPADQISGNIIILGYSVPNKESFEKLLESFKSPIDERTVTEGEGIYNSIKYKTYYQKGKDAKHGDIKIYVPDFSSVGDDYKGQYLFFYAGGDMEKNLSVAEEFVSNSFITSLMPNLGNNNSTDNSTNNNPTNQEMPDSVVTNE